MSKPETNQLRQFGLMVGGIVLIIGAWPLLVRSEDPRAWAVVLGGVLVIVGLGWPKFLGPVYRVWMLIGHGLGWINTRIILGLIFYGLFTPIGFIRRVLLRRDALHRRVEPEAATYRIARSPRAGSHMTQQF